MRVDYQHRYAAHCETGTVAGLLQHNGIPMDEAMVFGLGSGLYFGYFPFLKVGFWQLITYRNRPGTIFKNSVRRLGLDLHVRHFRDEQKAMDELDALLERGIPVGVQVGVYWLPYMPPPQRIHFNTHNAIVIGREGDDYIVSDPVMPGPVPCSREALQQARFAKGLMAPRGCRYYVEPGSSSDRELAPMVRDATLAVCSQMTTRFPMVGVRGIRLLAKNVRKWGRALKVPEIRLNLSDIIVMQELIGTGGGGYRFMYSAFLKEAALRTDNARLVPISEQFLDLGTRWREFAAAAHRWCKERTNPGEVYEMLPAMLEDIAGREQKAFADLKAAVN